MAMVLLQERPECLVLSTLASITIDASMSSVRWSLGPVLAYTVVVVVLRSCVLVAVSYWMASIAADDLLGLLVCHTIMSSTSTLLLTGFMSMSTMSLSSDHVADFKIMPRSGSS